MSKTSIEWCTDTWNPVRGCSRVSEGCRNCYAERMAARNLPEMRSPTTGNPFAVRGSDGPHWTGVVELIPEKLDEPLHWRKPRRVFVNSMSDLFHEALRDEAIDRMFGVMAQAPQHTFQILTKRPERMPGWFKGIDPDQARMSSRLLRIAAGVPWPLPNVWLGVSVEDQATADERIPLLLQTPAAKRFISLEPQLAPVDLAAWLPICADCNRHRGKPTAPITHHHPPALDWVIVGGESGPGARPFDVEWARSTVRQCREAGVACFVKQLGARLITYVGGEDMELVAGWKHRRWHDPEFTDQRRQEIGLRSSKGGDMAEWPADLRVREFPA